MAARGTNDDVVAVAEWLDGGGHVDAVKCDLDDPNMEVEALCGVTMLMIASRTGRESTVKLLLERRATVDQQDSTGSTALIAASMNGHLAVVRRLLKAGANAELDDVSGMTALQAAVIFYEDSGDAHSGAASAAARFGVEYNPWGCVAALKEHLQAVATNNQMLLADTSLYSEDSPEERRGVAIGLDASDDGTSARLFMASERCDAHMIYHLISNKGANVNRRVGGHLPLEAALRTVHEGQCDLKAIELLAEAGADLFAVIMEGETSSNLPLLWYFAEALGPEHPAMVMILNDRADGGLGVLEKQLTTAEIDPLLAEMQTATLEHITSLYPQASRDAAHSEAVTRQGELEIEVARLRAQQQERGKLNVGTVSTILFASLLLVACLAGWWAARGLRARMQRPVVRGGRGQRHRRGGKKKRDEQATEAASQPTDTPEWWQELSEFHADLEAAAHQEREAFICPIRCEIMRTPAMLLVGDVATHKYESDAITKWIEEHTTDPLTRAELSSRPKVLMDLALQREIRRWCEDKVRSWRRELHASRRGNTGPTVRSKVHVFLDHSNVWLGAKRSGKLLEPVGVVRFIEGRRDIVERVLIGSTMSDEQEREWRRLQYTTDIDRRGGKERFVDGQLHAHLMKAASKTFAQGRIIALATGDGNDNHGRTTFPECVVLALKNGWHVELYSWRESTNQIYYGLAQQYGEQFVLRYLDSM